MPSSSRLYTKEKLYIQVITKEKNSKKYVIDDDKIEKTMQKLKALSVSSSEFSINNQVSSAVDEAVIIVENYNDNAVKSLIDNPYRLLGIASNATISEANDAFEKIKKLDRLKAINSYKTEYEVAGFTCPTRDLAICQNALASIKDITHKWFWFDTPDACKKWQFQSYRDALKTNTFKNVSYDFFLAQYVYLLVFDKTLSQRAQWHTLFAYYQFVVGEGHIEKLKVKLNKSETVDIHDEDIITDFAKNIFNPVDVLLEDASIDALLSFFRSIRLDKYSSLKEFKRNVAGKIAQWFIKQEHILWEKIEKYIGIGELDEDAAYQVWLAAQTYDNSVQLIITNAFSALMNEPLRADMIKSSYTKVMEKVMILLIAGSNEVEACKYANYLYKYADDKAKIKLIGHFGVEKIAGAVNDVVELAKLLPKNQEKQLESVSDFEDITICENNGIVPRLDFCGLVFEYPYIGIRFWTSNRTDDTLKYWLMDIEVHGQDCESTEIICTVDSGEYSYYTYQLELPNNISYYDVRRISFYVEIDKPGNDTIHDTDTIRVNCDSRKEMLSVIID